MKGGSCILLRTVQYISAMKCWKQAETVFHKLLAGPQVSPVVKYCSPNVYTEKHTIFFKTVKTLHQNSLVLCV